MYSFEYQNRKKEESKRNNACMTKYEYWVVSSAFSQSIGYQLFTMNKLISTDSPDY